MTYIYDVLLNFTDENKIIEFFEWNTDDSLEHIKRIPILKVSTKTLSDFISYEIILDKKHIEEIKNTTIMYRKTKDLEYALLLTDSNKVIAFEFDKTGRIISKSGLLLDEEEDIIEEVEELGEQTIKYKLLNKININSFLTRTELKHQRYLLKEIDNLYKEKNNDKLLYLYEEIYKKDNLSITDKYMKLKNDILNNYSNIFNNLYEIVRLTYIKK